MISILRWLIAPHFLSNEPGGDGPGNGASYEMPRLEIRNVDHKLNHCILAEFSNSPIQEPRGPGLVYP